MSTEIRALIAEYDGETSDVATAVTLQVMTDKKMKGVVQQIVLGYVKDQVTQHRRQEARRIEDRAFAEGDPFEVAVSELPVLNPMAARQELLREKFFCSDCSRYVTWGEATVNCHLARAQYMRTLAHAVMQDAERHELAASKLKEYGAKNLDELEKVLAAH